MIEIAHMGKNNRNSDLVCEKTKVLISLNRVPTVREKLVKKE